MLGERVCVLDGGMASTLQSRGYQVDGDPLWSARLLATHPQAIHQVSTEFLEAGAEVITSASYQASVEGFQRHLGTTAEEALALITLSGSIAKKAVQEFAERREKTLDDTAAPPPPPLMPAGSVGPYGACLADGSEYTGAYVDTVSVLQLVEWHRPRIQALVRAGLEVVLCETIPALTEALALLSLLREFPDVKAWVSFSCKDHKHTSYGDVFATAARECHQRAGAGGQLLGVGVNCLPPHLVTPLLQDATQHLPPPSVLPRVVYPNSGEVWVAGKGWEVGPVADDDDGSRAYLRDLPRWASLGARLIGGCCRMGPECVKRIAGVVKELNKS